jgi:hypothetical protein
MKCARSLMQSPRNFSAPVSVLQQTGQVAEVLRILQTLRKHGNNRLTCAADTHRSLRLLKLTRTLTKVGAFHNR